MSQILFRHWRVLNESKGARASSIGGCCRPINRRKKSSISLVVRELQIKTTVRMNLISIGLAKMKTLDNAKCWRDCEAT